MTQPEGFVIPGREEDPVIVLKALYGCKQAPCLFSKKLKKSVKKAGFTPLTADGCVYYRRNADEFSILIFYVDDILYATNKKETVQPFIDVMKSEYEIRELPPTRFLGINIERKRETRQVFLSQRHTVLKMLEHGLQLGCRSR
jgi:hypothetical protein